jgi:uncharacterized protein (TIGR03790 family)
MPRAQALLALALLHAAACAGAQERHPEVLVVVNGESPVSTAIGRYYAARRGVPAENVVALRVPVRDPSLTTPRHEKVSRADFVRLVREPIAAFLRERDAAREIRILVTTSGVPLLVTGEGGGTPFERRTHASVDAELALLFSGRDGSPGMAGDVNPYFASEEPFQDWRRAHPEAPLRYLVARLTGYPTDLDAATGVPRDVKRLIDAAQAPPGDGVYLIDEDPAQEPGRREANALLLAPAAAALRALARNVVHDTTPAFAAGRAGLIGYASWGSNDRAAGQPPFYGDIDGRLVPGSFASRALTVDLVSTNARSFAWPADYGQSLVADLIRLGAAGAAGHAHEPMLQAVARPHLLLAAYARGVPAAEAYFRSIPYLGWTNVYVGDPLMRVADPAPAPADRDGDGVADASDACLWIPDPDQRDTDADGFGNACDADFDGDGRVTPAGGTGPPSDLDRLERSLRTGLYVPSHDLDGNGRIDAADVSMALLQLHLPPGPSGRVAGTPPQAGGTPAPGEAAPGAVP